MTGLEELEILLGIDGVTIVWVVRSHDAGPLPIIDNDPLPERQRLTRMANLQARGTHPRVDFRNGTSVESISEEHGDLVVTLDTRGSTDTIRVDRVLALVGYAPDSSMYRELHVHECYATEGPMSLAATLATESSTDCLAQESPGADVLRTPEPGFFILGAKSYGRNSSFLIRMGLEQVRQVYSLIEKDLRHRKAWMRRSW